MAKTKVIYLDPDKIILSCSILEQSHALFDIKKESMWEINRFNTIVPGVKKRDETACSSIKTMSRLTGVKLFAINNLPEKIFAAKHHVLSHIFLDFLRKNATELYLFSNRDREFDMFVLSLFGLTKYFDGFLFRKELDKKEVRLPIDEDFVIIDNKELKAVGMKEKMKSLGIPMDDEITFNYINDNHYIKASGFDIQDMENPSLINETMIKIKKRLECNL